MNSDASTDNPEFEYDKRSRRYRNKRTGRFISPEIIQSLTQQRIDLVAKDLRLVTDLVLERKISLVTWQRQTAETLKILHTQQYMLGIGGKSQLRREDYLEIARELKNQYKYLRGFAYDATQGTMTTAEFKARAELYALASKVSFFRGQKVAAFRAGYSYARRVLGIAEHCPECIQYAARGVVPIEEAVLPTQQCSCKVRCHCGLEYLLSAEIP